MRAVVNSVAIPGPVKTVVVNAQGQLGTSVTPAAKAKTRVFRFERGNGAWQVNGQFFDENVIHANPSQESEEVWVFQNGGGGWAHPVHSHYEECRVLSHNGVTVQPNTNVLNLPNASAARPMIGPMKIVKRPDTR